MSLSESPGIDRLNELEADYELISELGRGGTSVVYLARERDLNRDVAIKVVRSNQLDDLEAVARLAREAKLVAQLRHPNIVPLLSTRHLSDGSLALVMQHVPGHTLKSAIREAGPLPVAVVEHVLREVGAALDYAHRRHSVIHRDIKPENIYLDEECGRALLSDFGIARPGESESNLTLAGTALGTPAYMSPEQIDGIPLDGRSDLYSLGLVAYEMLTGQQPWAGSNLYTIIYKQKHEELPALVSFRSDVPEHLQRTIAGLLHKDREARWADTAQFLAQLPASSINVLDLAVPKREQAAIAEPVAEDTPTLRYRRDDVDDEAEVETPDASAAIVAPSPDEPLPFEFPAPRRRAAPGRSYAVPDAPTPRFEVAEPAPVPMPMPKASVERGRKPRISSRALTFAHISKPRSRLVAATTAFLVLGVTATVVATMNRNKGPEVQRDNGANLASPAATGMLAAGVAAAIDTTRSEPEDRSASVAAAPEQVEEKAAEPRDEREERDERAERDTRSEPDKSEKEPKPKSEEAPKPQPTPEPQSRTLAKSVAPAATQTIEPPPPAVREEEAREIGVPTTDTAKIERTEIDTTPVFTPYTVKPELRNRDEVQRSLSRYYPRRLREAGVGGVVMLWALIDESGNVAKAQLKDRSGNAVLDQAALKVAESMRFTPALNRDQKVRVWIELPLVFKSE